MGTWETPQVDLKKLLAFCLGEIFGEAAAPPQWQQAQEDEAGGFFWGDGGGKVSGFYGSFLGGYRWESRAYPWNIPPYSEARLYLLGIPESFEDAWGMVVGYLEVLLERPFQSGSSPNTWEIS